MRLLSVVRLGTVSYSEGLLHQAHFSNLVRKSIESGSPRHFLLLLEHTPVYTVGIRSTTVSSEEEARLRSIGADFYRTSRGGLITFHGPGQLVAYPICALKDIREDYGKGKVLGVRKYVEGLEESIILTVAGRGISGVGRVCGLPGVWVDGARKVASLGVSFAHGITGHGLALNCDVDLGWFDKIVACGIKGVEVTSMERETASPQPVSTIAPSLIQHFCDVLQFQPADYQGG